MCSQIYLEMNIGLYSNTVIKSVPLPLIASFSDMDCDVERANAVGDKLLHHQPLDGRHHQRHLQRHPQLHLHAHGKLAFW